MVKQMQLDMGVFKYEFFQNCASLGEGDQDFAPQGDALDEVCPCVG